MRLDNAKSMAILITVGILFFGGTLAYLDFIQFNPGSGFTTLAQSNGLKIRDTDEDWTTEPENLEASLHITGWMPGDTYRGWISLKNSSDDRFGSLLMDWRATDGEGTLTEAESGAEGGSPVDNLSTQIIVDNILYGPVSDLENITDNIEDNLGVEELTVNVLDQEKIDLEEMLPSAKSGMDSEDVENLIFDFIFNPNAGNEYQGDNCVVDIIFYASTQTPNDPPIADAGGPYSVMSGNSIELDGTDSGDPEDDEFSYSWEIIDDPTGSASLTVTGTATPIFTAPSVSSIRNVKVELTVKDDRERSHSDTAIVTVKPTSNPPANDPPNAEFTYSPTEPEVNENVSFDASGSSDPDGSIVSYDWAFGDGSTGTGASPTHSYAEKGVFEVTLTVTDDDGASSTASENVNVISGSSGASPTAEFEVTDMTVEPSEVNPDEEVIIRVTVTNGGEVGGTYTAQPAVEEGNPAPQDVSIGPGESETVTFTVSRSEPKTYDVSIEEHDGEFTVLLEKTPETPFPTMAVAGIALIILLFALVFGFYLRREEEEEET